MTSATAHTVGSAVLHPQQTLKGVGTATKSAVVGGSLGYIGWETDYHKFAKWSERFKSMDLHPTKSW